MRYGAQQPTYQRTHYVEGYVQLDLGRLQKKQMWHCNSSKMPSKTKILRLSACFLNMALMFINASAELQQLSLPASRLWYSDCVLQTTERPFSVTFGPFDQRGTE